MNQFNVQALLSALIHIRDNGPNLIHSGLCVNINSVLIQFGIYDKIDERAMKTFMRLLFMRWPEFSGMSHFPVPSFSELPPSDAYFVTEIHWRGEYGEARKRLVTFMIEAIEKEVIQ